MKGDFFTIHRLCVFASDIYYGVFPVQSISRFRAMSDSGLFTRFYFLLLRTARGQTLKPSTPARSIAPKSRIFSPGSLRSISCRSFFTRSLSLYPSFGQSLGSGVIPETRTKCVISFSGAYIKGLMTVIFFRDIYVTGEKQPI